MGDPHGDPQTSPQHPDPHGLGAFLKKTIQEFVWTGVLWAGLRAAMWITHVGGKFRHGLLEKSLNLSGYKNALKNCFGAVKKVGKGEEQNVPEFFEIPSRVLHRILLRFLPDFVRALCQIPRQIRRNIHKRFWESSKRTVLAQLIYVLFSPPSGCQ